MEVVSKEVVSEEVVPVRGSWGTKLEMTGDKMRNYQVVFEEPGYPRMYAKKTCRKCHGMGNLGFMKITTKDEKAIKPILCTCLLRGIVTVPEAMKLIVPNQIVPNQNIPNTIKDQEPGKIWLPENLKMETSGV
jgi:hypothetical protein